MARERKYLWDAFVSHNKLQKPWVRSLVKQWRGLGLQVFFDEDSIDPGDNVVHAIDRALQDCRHTVFIITPTSVDSQWAAMEAACCHYSDPNSDGKRLIPVMIEPTSYSKISLSVKTRKVIDLTDPKLRQANYHFLLRFLGVKSMHLPDPPDLDAEELEDCAVEDDYCDAHSAGIATQVATGICPIEITIKGDFDSFTCEDQERVLRAIGELLAVSGDIRLISRTRGSVKLVLALSHEQSGRLYKLIKEGCLAEYGVVDARYVESHHTGPLESNVGTSTEVQMANHELAKGPVRKAFSLQYGAVLAYNGEDHASVIAIYDELKRRGIEPWIDSRDHRPGDKWAEGFRAALCKTSVALVFFGPNGTGKWQDEEIPLIHTQCVARNIVLIPVLLPGGVIPDDMPFATRSAVKFIAGSNDSDALDKLEFGITGRNPRDRRGRFEILAEVVRTEPNCFLAVSHATSSEIYEIMRQAALDVGLVVKQPREFTDDPHDIYSPEVVVAIRSATVILADGTPHPETKKPDADVMYETGVAEAFAKPMIFVSTPQTNALPLPIFVCNGTCSRIEYDPNEVNFAGRLREALASRLREIVKGLRPPHLLPNNNLGLSVAYSEIHHHRAVFWQPFAQIIHYGLSIKKVFAEILKPVHKMQQIIDLAHADAVAVKELADLGDSLRQFREVYDQFYKPRVSDLVLADAWKETKAEAADGFDVLLKISAETNDPNRSIQPIIRSSYKFFLIVETYLEEFLRADGALFSRIEKPSTNTLHQVIHLHRDVQPLASSAELVPANACVMMFQLLELIGMRSELGEPSNANERS